MTWPEAKAQIAASPYKRAAEEMLKVCAALEKRGYVPERVFIPKNGKNILLYDDCICYVTSEKGNAAIHNFLKHHDGFYELIGMNQYDSADSLIATLVKI